MKKPQLLLSLFIWTPLLLPNIAYAAKAPPAVDPRLCQQLVKHTPTADVEYQPGVAADGHSVAPADLPGGSNIKMPSTIQVPITIQLAGALHLDTSKYPYNDLGAGTEATIGVLSVTDGHVLFNGKPISDDDQDNLAVLCMQENGQ